MSIDEIRDQQKQGSIKIISAYKQAFDDVCKIGKLLRTTESGKYMWSRDHRNAITGIKVILKKLSNDVPRYNGKTL